MLTADLDLAVDLSVTSDLDSNPQCVAVDCGQHADFIALIADGSAGCHRKEIHLCEWHGLCGRQAGARCVRCGAAGVVRRVMVL